MTSLSKAYCFNGDFVEERPVGPVEYIGTLISQNILTPSQPISPDEGSDLHLASALYTTFSDPSLHSFKGKPALKTSPPPFKHVFKIRLRNLRIRPFHRSSNNLLRLLSHQLHQAPLPMRPHTNMVSHPSDPRGPCETIGYIARSVSADETLNYTMGPYIM